MTTTQHADPTAVVAIHDQMRRDLTRYLAAVERSTDADRAGRLRPMAKWAAGFARELHLHHTVEDEVIFPALAERAPDVAAVLAALDADHRQVAELLARWAPTAKVLARADSPFTRSRDAVVEVVGTIRDILRPHLDIEDRELVPRLVERFTPAEYDTLDERIKRSLPVQGLGFAVPWNVGAVPEAERAAVVAGSPLPLRVLYRLTNGRHQRLVEASFQGVPVPALR